MVLAGLAAEGLTVIDDIKYIERGYEDFPEKLKHLGAHMEKVESDKDLRKFEMKIG